MVNSKAFLFTIVSLLTQSRASGLTSPRCRCIPGDACWPRNPAWDALNATTAGQLIAVQPVAISCYPGPLFNNDICAQVNQNWDLCAWQAEHPAGLCQEGEDLACRVITPPAAPGASCTLGNQPIYAINATTAEHVSAGVQFARKNNIRLVVRLTGHDFNRRSQGFGSLEIWLRYFRNGIDFQETFRSNSGCTRTPWTGSAIKVRGGYQFSDLWTKAKQHNVVVVTGGAPSIGVIGGWLQGGGLGPASHHWGIGADQLLEAEVVLADGSIVTVNACQNTEVYRALRGGGPSTYAVVLSATLKAHRNVPRAIKHTLSFPFTPENRSLYLDGLTTIYSSAPDLMDAGYALFGFYSAVNASLTGQGRSGYSHKAYVMDQTMEEAKATMAPVEAKLKALGVNYTITWDTYDDFWSLFDTVAGTDNPGFPTTVSHLRFLDREALQARPARLRNMIDISVGKPQDSSQNAFECMSAGQVWKDASDPLSSAHPTWRKSYCLHLVLRLWPDDASAEYVAAVKHDVTVVKGRAMDAVAPNTGTYMNYESNREDPDWKRNFYGSENYKRLLGIKRRHDPNDVFYCPACVGSDRWAEDKNGRLCKV
ncbi:isoamyl alcohol oxidase [Fusarium sp. NRRL 25303]|nr:isoamyl alcohol oxidase [Fusarium sp. NRRL 25303]